MSCIEKDAGFPNAGFSQRPQKLPRKRHYTATGALMAGAGS